MQDSDTDKVQECNDAPPCPHCGDTCSDNRAVRPWGFCGSELYCLKCNKIIGQIGG